MFSKKKIFIFLFLFALALLTLLPSSPIIRGLGRDSGVFLYIGSTILDGQIPYRDAWDHKGPVTFYINAAGLALGRGTRQGVWALEVLSLFATLTLLFLTLKQVFVTSLALFGALSLSIGMLFVLEGGNLTEEYALLFQSLALYLLTRDVSRPAKRYPFLLGFSLAMAFWLRQNLTGIWIAIVLYWLGSAVSSQTWNILVRRLSLLALGFAGISALILSYFAAQHALGAMWEAVFEYNVVYSSQLPIASRIKAPFKGINYLASSGLSLLAFSGWFLATFRMIENSMTDFSKVQRALICVAWIGLPVEILFTSLSGRHYPHYFIAWLPVLVVLGCYFLSHLQSQSVSGSRIGSISRKALLASLAIGMMLHTLNIWAYTARRFADHFINGDSSDPVQTLIERSTRPDSYVLMWGAEAKYNYLAGRKSPTRYVYQYPLYMRRYHTPAMINEFLNELMEQSPEIIIDASPSNSNIPPIDRTEREKWHAPADPAYGVLPETEAVFEYIESHYQFTGLVGEKEWRVYVKKTDRKAE